MRPMKGKTTVYTNLEMLLHRILTTVLYMEECVVQIRDIVLQEEKHGHLCTDKAQLENKMQNKHKMCMEKVGGGRPKREIPYINYKRVTFDSTTLSSRQGTECPVLFYQRPPNSVK